MIKKGDIVVIKDCSYSHIVKDGDIRECRGSDWIAEDKFKVLKTECKIFPPEFSATPAHYTDTILLNLATKAVWFAWSGGLHVIHHIIVIDGKEIKISYESYLNLKRQLT